MNMGYKNAIEHLKYVAKRHFSSDKDRPIYDEMIAAIEDLEWVIEQFEYSEKFVEAFEEMVLAIYKKRESK